MIHSEDIRPVYQMPAQVNSYDVDPDGKLRLSAILQWQQEAAERQFTEGGLDFAALSREGMAFLAVQNRLLVRRRPRSGEQVTVETWLRGTKGIRFYRCSKWYDQNGDALIEGVCAVTLADVHKHTLLRPSAFDRFHVATAPDRANNCPDPERLRVVEGLPPVGEQTIRYSHLDYNGHYNNCFYADLLCDFSPVSPIGREITEVTIEYLHEAKEGDTLAVFADEQWGTVRLQAMLPDRACFAAEMKIT